MRVLKLHKVNDLYRLECSGCRSLLEVNKNEMTCQHDPREGGAYTFVCCVCQHVTWVSASLVDKAKQGGG